MPYQQWFKPKPIHSSQRVLYTNARIVDPESNTDITGQLITEGKFIAGFGANLIEKSNIPDNMEVVDCKGNVLAPGLIDIQVHFREPGQEHKETLETGSKSAAAGGVTLVVCQPNTKPVIDSVEVMEFIKARARDTAYINIRAYGAISKGMKGEELSDIGMLKCAGAVGFTDDGLPVMNAQLMRQAFTYSKQFNIPIAQHAEDLNLSNGGAINEGIVSTQLGVRGIPNVSEAVIVERDILLLELTGGHYHVLHVSTKEALDAIRRGKNKGLNVTCEVAPHHFTLTEDAVLGFNTNAKMNPPLRTDSDRRALIEGLKDGTIDAIATDHAPHDQESKRVPLQSAAFGIVGLETMLPLSLELYHDGVLSLQDLLARMTYKAADIIHEPRGRIKKGGVADLTLIDLDAKWTIESDKFSSKSKNSPFDGRRVKGRAIQTIVGGQTVYKLAAQSKLK